MKQFILFTFLQLLFTGYIAATTPSPFCKDPQYPGPRPHSLPMSYIQVSTTSSAEKYQSDNFDSSVDTATITVYDAFNQIIEQEVVDETLISEVYIPVYAWESGNYTVTINQEN